MNGSVTFTIPAGVLPVGDDPLTASYTPDAASSSIYNLATGTSYVTVSVFKPTPVVTVTPSSSTVTTYQAFSITVDVSGGSGNPAPDRGRVGNPWAVFFRRQSPCEWKCHHQCSPGGDRGRRNGLH